MRIRYTATVVALAAAVTAFTGGAVAAAPTPAGCGWQLAATPPVPGTDTLAGAPGTGGTIVAPSYGQLYDVDVLNRKDVRVSGGAVYPIQAGWLLQGSGASLATASEQPPGVPYVGAPATTTPESYDSADDGWVMSNQIGTAPAAERWHDGHWTLVQLATLTGALAWPQHYSGITGLKAFSPTNAWAVGGIWQGLALTGTVIEHWDGTAWQLVPHPLSAAESTLFTGLTAPAPDDMWLVGEQVDADGVLVPISEHWDGARWSMMAVPPGTGNSKLLQVSASGSDAWAVGAQTIPGSDGLAAPLIEHFDGTKWQVVQAPDLGNSELTDVYVAAPDDAWAVGLFAFGLSQVFVHWDGHTWAPVAVPGPQKYNVGYTYNAIDGTGSEVWAVGWVDDYGNQTTYPVAAHLGCRS